MTRTIRIYNNPNLKKTPRYNLDEINKKFLETGEVSHITNTGIPFTKKSWICVGNCKYCKDPSNSTKQRRLSYKNELLLQLKEEKDLLKNCSPIELLEDIFYELEFYNY